MARALGALAALLLCTALSAPVWAQNLQGYWISKVDHDAGAVLLHFDEKLAAHFRPARSGRWEAVTVSGKYELRRQSGGLISLRHEDGRLVGKMTENGKSYPVAFDHSTLPDIHQWIAENPPAGARASRNSTIELLYVGAADCGFCRRWEAKYLDGPKPREGLGWQDVRFTSVDIGSFRVHFGAADIPAALRPAIAKTLEADGVRLLRGTPWFALLVNGEVRAQAFGINTFETLIQPAIRAALREKAA